MIARIVFVLWWIGGIFAIGFVAVAGNSLWQANLCDRADAEVANVAPEIAILARGRATADGIASAFNEQAAGHHIALSAAMRIDSEAGDVEHGYALTHPEYSHALEMSKTCSHQLDLFAAGTLASIWLALWLLCFIVRGRFWRPPQLPAA